MNRYIKVQLLKNGVPISDRLYLYKTNLDVQLGEIIQASEHLQGVVAGFEVISNIADPTNVKSIAGQMPTDKRTIQAVEPIKEPIDTAYIWRNALRIGYGDCANKEKPQ